MAHENLAFAVIAILIIVVFLFIFFRIWEIIKPYIILARKIIKVVDIIKTFTVDVALTLLNLIKDVVTGIFRIFIFDDIIVIALNNVVAKIDDVLDEKTITHLVSQGKRIVITAIGQSAENAITFANQLVDKLAPVSLVLFDPQTRSHKVDDRIHIITIKSKDLNVSARGMEDSSEFYVSQAKNSKVKYNITKPQTIDVNSYMIAVKNGFI